jgi:hypothetical protein
VALLRSTSLSILGIANLNECKPFSNTDVEVDFFNDILHILVYNMPLFSCSSNFLLDVESSLDVDWCLFTYAKA